MKAIVYHRYGTPDEFRFEEVPQPKPGEKEVLIKVKASSINSWDWDLMRGKPYIVRVLGGGLSKPGLPILGCDVAGVVEAIGSKVTRLKVGDEVCGDLSQGKWGGFAEYVCAPEKHLTLKPESVSFEEAAALPQAGVMALQGIRDYGKVKPDHHVLINGAGGGVGSYAIQLAKSNGAIVTGVDHSGKFDMMQSLGADLVLDFRKEDITKGNQQFDFILDVIGHHSIFEYQRILKPAGIYSMVGGRSREILMGMLVAPVISYFGKKTLGILAHEPNKNLNMLLGMLAQGTLKTHIDSTFPLKETREAFKHFGSGQFCGKVVIKP